MRTVLYLTFAALLVAGIAWSPAPPPPPVAKIAAGYVKEYTTTLTDTSTDYVEIDGWFWQAVDLSIQVEVDTNTGGSGTVTDFTLQGSNDLEDPTPTWVNLYSVTDSTWLDNEDVLLSGAVDTIFQNIPYGRVRLKYDLAGPDTASVTIKTYFIAKL